ncbi:uncharacterized protein EV422DRAFT_505105 [Fimicolochytrium jonesii]|uniref:uncharacterized protein n=1 Tax=Fimicolochytrium jonesii TaxID=1396493 RepID=UPI0022FDB0DA|nr:uncharacterized protein EV422DRAFT_505105 [Fimicolochytrium jonesii]KAI8823065.1 hypothetical protein EV422DRAFT_505105 [Fimicolochytrium jonesii]
MTVSFTGANNVLRFAPVVEAKTLFARLLAAPPSSLIALYAATLLPDADNGESTVREHFSDNIVINFVQPMDWERETSAGMLKEDDETIHGWHVRGTNVVNVNEELEKQEWTYHCLRVPGGHTQKPGTAWKLLFSEDNWEQNPSIRSSAVVTLMAYTCKPRTVTDTISRQRGTTLLCNAAALLSERDYQAKRPKMCDGKGLDPGSNSELMIMGASSNPRTKENVTHSIDDSAKIIQLCTNALKLELLKHKEKKRMQLRSAEIPMRWRERSKVLQVCELVAAAYSTLLEQQELMERICEEESGAIEVPEEERARQVLKKLSITACEP